MINLNTAPNLENIDEFYARLLARHDGLSKDQSDAYNARLILLLANHIGNAQILDQALNAAAKS